MRCHNVRTAGLAVALALAVVGVCTPEAGAHNPSNFYDLRWPAYAGLTTIDYSVASGRNAGGFPHSDFRRRIKKAADRFNVRNRGVRFNRAASYTGRATPEQCLQSNGKRINLIRYGPIDHKPRGVIAMTHRCISNGKTGNRTYPRHLLSFTTTFDAEEDWYTGTGGPRGRTDFSSIATHELAHGLGAGHYSQNTSLCNDGLTQETMCLKYVRGASRQRSMAKHDLHTFDAAYPSPVWWADAERPGSSGRSWDREWASDSSLECHNERRARRVTSHNGVTPRQGNAFYALTTTDSDHHIPNTEYGIFSEDGTGWRSERCELAHGNPSNPRQSFPHFREGDEVWFSWWVRFPAGFQTQYPGSDPCMAASPGHEKFLLVAQWKQGDQPPTIAFAPSGSQFCLNTLNTGGGNQNFQLGAFRTGQWLPFTMHVKFSSGSGLVELCGDIGDGQGFRQFFSTSARTMTGSSSLHQRIGVYRGRVGFNGAQDVYFDGWTVATTREAAERTAFPDLATPAGICSAGATGSYALP